MIEAMLGDMPLRGVISFGNKNINYKNLLTFVDLLNSEV